MTDLFLVFLGAAYLENLLLWRFFDIGGRTATGIAGKLLAVSASLLMLALILRIFPLDLLSVPPRATAYLHALAFVTTAMAIAPRADAPALASDPTRLSLLRRYLPLLVANLAVLAFVALDGRRVHDLREALGFCLVASLALCLAMLLASPLRQRVEGAAVPRRWRGLPILALTACLAALALAGYRGVLPW